MERGRDLGESDWDADLQKRLDLLVDARERLSNGGTFTLPKS